MDVYAYTLHPRSTPGSRRDDSYSPPGLGDPEGVLPSRWFSGTTKEELHEFLASDLDLLVISTPLTDKTRHLSACQPSIPSQPINGPCYSSLLVYLRLTIDDAVSAPEFEVLAKKKAFVSNIGRGPIGA